MNSYHVSYVHKDGFGTIDYNPPTPITNRLDLAPIERHLRSEGLVNPVVIAFSRYDDPGSAPRR